MKSLQDLLADLISYQSITPDDVGCQAYIIDYLQLLGFDIQQFNQKPVSNFFARFGKTGPLLIFAGHTDVVHPGEQSKWMTDPFTLEEKDGMLFGRGCADMKGSIASMMIAASKFVHNHSQLKGSLGFLITSGEEGDLFDLGTPYVMSELKKQGIKPDYCIVGEPSSTHMVGDVIKIGRRGSLTGSLTLHGTQGHVAYPHLADNPIHRISPVLNELTNTVWDNGNTYFPATSLQITHLQSGGQAGNIIPGELTLQFNFRYSTEQTAQALMDSVDDIFKRYNVNASIKWRLNGEPFLTEKGALITSTIKRITAETGVEPTCSTSGGTSDGRFIAPYGVEVVELGPINATIHQVNECVSLTDLTQLSNIYYSICTDLLT